jgi:hypothetical protein
LAEKFDIEKFSQIVFDECCRMNERLDQIDQHRRNSLSSSEPPKPQKTIYVVFDSRYNLVLRFPEKKSMSSVHADSAKGFFSRFATHAITLALSGVVAWLTSVYFENKKAAVDEQRFARDLGKDKIEIINLVKDRDTPLALALIEYFRIKFAASDPDYDKFLEAISGYIGSAPGKITKEQPPSATDVSGTTTEIVRNQFFSVNRRQYAEYLVDQYRNDQRSQSQIVSALLDAIIPKVEDPTRYRVNLYIALTFSLLPRTSMSNSDLQRLRALKDYPEYNNDRTFKLNVDNALAKQGAT